MRHVGTIKEVRAAVATARAEGRRIGLVPTMGALHGGHVALVRALDEIVPEGLVVVSGFVNPTQFGPGEGFREYPRDLGADAEMLAGLGRAAPDLIYAPSVEEMYPPERNADGRLATTVSVARLSERLCGASRPGHFDGVCTVVAKLFHQVRPDVAVFGRKDFQQLQIVRRMVADLDMGVEVVDVPTVREPDGLAMSTRNAYLSPDERRAALAIPHGLADAVRAAQKHREAERPVSAEVLRERVLDRIAQERAVRADYVEVVDPDTLTADPRAEERGRLLVAVAAFVGSARLIDNVVAGDEADERRLLDAVG
jgi:pantoate--beta-alanine ligase